MTGVIKSPLKSDPPKVNHLYRDPQGLIWKVTEITEPHHSVVAEARDERIRDRNFYLALEWERSGMTEIDLEGLAQFVGHCFIPVGFYPTVRALVIAAHESKLGALAIRPAKIRKLVESLACTEAGWEVRWVAGSRKDEGRDTFVFKRPTTREAP